MDVTVLDKKTRELIGVATSVVAKCQPCLEYHLAEVRKAGAADSEIRDAINLARKVRAAGDEHMDKFADQMLGIPSEAQDEQRGCLCSQDNSAA
jgi:AhpD family alkylhydroperoxidase